MLQFLRGGAQCSAALVRSLKHWEDGILLNGAHARTVDLLNAGDRLAIAIHDGPSQELATGEPVPILYEDRDVMVLDKPDGMPCHPSRGHQAGTLANAFAGICAERGENHTFRAVSRLDRDTTGAVVVAKNAYAASQLAGKVDKTYLAVASPAPYPAEGLIDAPIARETPGNMRRVVREDGKRAVTSYRTLYADRDAGWALVSCSLLTGRTHQIRVHMAHIGCPLVGDTFYGGPGEALSRQALHCYQVRFRSPENGRIITVTAPVPKDMQKFAGNGTIHG